MSMAASSAEQVSWWREPTKDQWLAWVAAWLGWTLDAFDFTVFLLIMVPIAQEFDVPLTDVAFVLTITLWLRLVGAVASGWLADRVGRKIPLMISILWYSLANFIAGFSPTFLFLAIFRAILGIGMGAEWPAGAALAMETWPARSRGFMGGILQGGGGGMQGQMPTYLAERFPDRGQSDGDRLLLPSGGDLGRLRSAGADLLRGALRARLRHPDDDRNLRWRDELRPVPSVRPGDQGQGAGARSDHRLTASAAAGLAAGAAPRCDVAALCVEPPLHSLTMGARHKHLLGCIRQLLHHIPAVHRVVSYRLGLAPFQSLPGTGPEVSGRW
jgi:hypothetical protein